ncbi:glycerate kinase [Euzebya tangerina]|uniref:glycerate kinase n=1 Tax=Euzebya tangerina TaxID=591198 RepID=UPI000E30E587|nr:glycerate kinase [Euzebya tangerina]
MRVIICPDKFAGTLTAAEAAAAIGTGWRAVRPDDELAAVPLADGGEGTIQATLAARPDAERHQVEVADARGIATTAAWLSLAAAPPSGDRPSSSGAFADPVAVVEVAQACGLSALAKEARDPLRTTTYGVGQLLQAVFDHGARQVIVGLGGSATVDGGLGMVSALTGHAVRRADGNGVKVGGRWVAEADHIRSHPDRSDLSLIVAGDVTNPLLGPDGAAAVFGPQKGADEAAVRELEAALATWADVAERDLPGGPWRDRPGAGAAGGLGFAFMALLGAEVRNGADVIGHLIGLDVTDADIVITGEGSLDQQSLAGKGPERIRSRAAAAGVTTVALAGVISDGAGDRFDIAEALGPDGLSDPIGTLTAAASRAARRLSGS